MPSGVAEEYWPDMAGLEYRDPVIETLRCRPGRSSTLPSCTLLTTSTIDRLRELYPRGRFRGSPIPPQHHRHDRQRIPASLENDWIGRTVVMGATVRLAITEPCPRCVMITPPQTQRLRNPPNGRTTQ